MIKKYISIICLFAIFSSCDKLDELTKFDMEYSQRATIPSSAGIDLPFDVFTPEMETNSESTFAVNDTRKDLIAADDLEEIRIAYLEEVPEDAGNVITLDTSDADLKEYIKKDQFSLRLNTVTDELMSTDHELEVNSTFFVDAKILGL